MFALRRVAAVCVLAFAGLALVVFGASPVPALGQSGTVTPVPTASRTPARIMPLLASPTATQRSIMPTLTPAPMGIISGGLCITVTRTPMPTRTPIPTVTPVGTVTATPTITPTSVFSAVVPMDVFTRSLVGSGSYVTQTFRNGDAWPPECPNGCSSDTYAYNTTSDRFTYSYGPSSMHLRLVHPRGGGPYANSYPGAFNDLWNYNQPFIPVSSTDNRMTFTFDICNSWAHVPDIWPAFYPSGDYVGLVEDTTTWNCRHRVFVISVQGYSPSGMVLGGLMSFFPEGSIQEITATWQTAGGACVGGLSEGLEPWVSTGHLTRTLDYLYSPNPSRTVENSSTLYITGLAQYLGGWSWNVLPGYVRTESSGYFSLTRANVATGQFRVCGDFSASSGAVVSLPPVPPDYCVPWSTPVPTDTFPIITSTVPISWTVGDGPCLQLGPVETVPPISAIISITWPGVAFCLKYYTLTNLKLGTIDLLPFVLLVLNSAGVLLSVSVIRRR